VLIISCLFLMKRIINVGDLDFLIVIMIIIITDAQGSMLHRYEALLMSSSRCRW